MSQQGEPDRRQEDQWWHQLYGAPEHLDPPAPSADSVDDHFATVRTVMGGGAGSGNQGAGPGGGPGPGADSGHTAEGLRGPGSDPDPGSASGAESGDPPASGPPARRGPDTVVSSGTGPTVPGRGQRPGHTPTLRLRSLSHGSDGTATEAHGIIAPSADPAGLDDPPAHVGDRPPTYDPEPTAWPAADPEDLDSLTPDTVLDGGRYGRLTVRAASVRGDSARYRGQQRRDALLAARFGEGDSALLLMVVACGVRAAEDSHRAAREACRWIASAVGRHSERLCEDIRKARRGSLKSGLHRLTDRCLGQLRLRAGERGYEPEEYSAALRCLLLPVDPQCRTRVFFGVGEGGLFRLRDGEWQDLDPQRDPAETDPAALRLPQAADPSDIPLPPRFRFRASVGHPGDVLLLCTEGMAEPLRGEPALAGLLAERWSAPAAPPGLAAFLRDAQIRVKGYADDRTAVAAWET